MVADGGCESGDAQWMLNTAGQTPCQVAESLVRVCAATARVQLLPVDVTCSTLGVANNASCCCSTVTYALAAACLVCQTGRTDLQPSTTYAAWLADCSTIAAVGTLPAVVRFADPPVLVPRWAHVRPANLSSRWDIALAQRAVNHSPISTSSPPAIPSPSALSAASASSTTPDPPPDPPKPTFPATPVVIVCVGALVLVLAMAHWLYKRRNRVSPSARPPPGFSIDDDPSPPPVQRDEESAGGWMSRWKKSKSKNGGGSDPGKIDAWHYPFDYTPVSVADSGSSPSHKHQHHPSGSHQPYYDPYVAGGSTSRVTLQLDEPNAEDRRRERHERRARRDERHARSSSETRLIPRGRVSSETLRPGTAPGQGLMPQTSMATLSPTPGYAIPPGYTASPMYLHPGVSRSHVSTPVPPGQPLFGSSVTAYVSTAPPTPTPGPSTPRAGGHSPVPLPTLPPPSQPRSGHSPRPHTHTHTFEVRLNPDQYAELRSRYPELQVRTKKHKRRGRDRGEGQPDEEERRGRPRSWSMPVQPPAPPEVGGGAGDDDDDLDDGDRRPRNGPELAEKYRRRRRRRGTDAEAPKEEVVSVVQGPLNEVRRDKGRSRAVDGGVSLMGGPPVVR